MNRPYMFGYSTVIRDNPCDCPFSETTRSEHHRHENEGMRSGAALSKRHFAPPRAET